MFEDLFSEELQSLRIKCSFNRLLFGTIIASSFAALIFFLFSQTEPFFKSLISLAILFLPPSLLYFLLDYLHDGKLKQIDAELPEALFQIAAFPQNTSMEKIIESVAEKKTPLGREFLKAHNLIKAGFATSEALETIGNDSGSPLLRRSVSLIIQAYESGSDLGICISEIASDIFEMQSLRKEASSLAAMQKYTLLAGSGVLIPLILGLLLGIVSSLPMSEDATLQGFGHNHALLLAIDGSIHAYLLILAALCAIFVAFQDGKIKKAPVYFCMLLPSSQFVFLIVKGANPLG